MNNKKVLISLMDFIKKSTGMSDQDISKGAGYAKNYLSVCLSNGNVSDKMIDKVKLIYADELKQWRSPLNMVANTLNEDEADYKVRRKTPNDKMIVQDGLSRMYESQLRVEARQMVMRNFLAEIYAKVYNQPVAKVLDEMGDLEKKSAARLTGE